MEEEITIDSIELLADSVYHSDYLPEDYSMDEWFSYFEQHGAFPREEGQELEYVIEVRVNDQAGKPSPGKKVAFSADGGHLSSSLGVSDAFGRVSITWSFDGSWETWGNFYLTISAFTEDERHLNNSPITVESVINAPPGV